MKVKYKKPKTLHDMSVGSHIRYRDYEYKLVCCTVLDVKVINGQVHMRTTATDPNVWVNCKGVLKKHKRIMHMPSYCGGDFGTYILNRDGVRRSYKITDWTLNKRKSAYVRHWVHFKQQLNPAIVLKRRTIKLKWQIFLPNEDKPYMEDDGYGDLQQVAILACGHLEDWLLRQIITAGEW